MGMKRNRVVKAYADYIARRKGKDRPPPPSSIPKQKKKNRKES